MNENSREKIKLRMLKRISQIWDIDQTQNIEPIFKLLT